MKVGSVMIGILIADDARVVGGRGSHHEGRDDRVRARGLRAEVLNEVLRRRLADAGREAAGITGRRADCPPGR